MKDRHIEENIRTVADSRHYRRQKQLTGILLLIDFEKALNSVELDYIEGVLKAYKFRKDFRAWFSILYNNSCSCAINNGFHTNFFKIERSCRQRDLLSPYLFILAIEPLAVAMMNNDKIISFVFNEKLVKIG